MCSGPTTRRGTFLAEVLRNERICEDHYRLVLAAPGFPPSRPGQFVQLQCRYPGEQVGAREADWAEGSLPRLTQPELTDREPLLRRPLSLAAVRRHAREAVELDLIYRIVGVGTRWLSSVRPGDALSLIGPLGNAFPIRPDKPRAALVGGGVGIPPMLYLAEALREAGKTAVAFSGARTAGLLPLRLLPNAGVRDDGMPSRCVAEFAEWDAEAAIATDDGTLGFAGLVSEPFRRWLEAAEVRAADLVVYSCGPEPMMKAVGDICARHGVECLLSLERHMACGMGTCQSCVVKIRDNGERKWSYKLCCADGPVFDARQIIWK